MEPKLKVFLSSAQFQDEFLVEREMLPVVFDRQPLVACFFLWRIEDYSSPECIEDHYAAHISDSDLMVLLIGKTFRPAVAREFERAIHSRKPVFAFIKDYDNRDPDVDKLICRIQQEATTASRYSSVQDLVRTIENSILQYYVRRSPKPAVVEWRNVHELHAGPLKAEERTLRLLVGILATAQAVATADTVMEALIALSAEEMNGNFTISQLEESVMRTFRTRNPATKNLFTACVAKLSGTGMLISNAGNLLSLDERVRTDLQRKTKDFAATDNEMFTRLFNDNCSRLRNVAITKFREVLQSVVMDVVYETAMSVACSEFGCSVNPFSVDADEVNRLIVAALSKRLGSGEDIGAWQPVLVDVLLATDEKIIAWLNRLRKSYWSLAVLGLDPASIEYRAERFREYCVYLDSHIVLRAMVEAGGQSQMCRQIIHLGRELGITMRLSDSMFREVEQAFTTADKTFHAAGRDVMRALAFIKAVRRKGDIFEGYLLAKATNEQLSWENYINRFFSAYDSKKLANFIATELYVTVEPTSAFSSEQWVRIEEITSRLLERRRKMVAPPTRATQEELTTWEREYKLRLNEAKQMATVYELRASQQTKGKHYWFVTFDEFVYEVSVSLIRSGDGPYGFPCFMKPALWLEMLVAASPQSMSLNTFRDVLLSKQVQQVADYVETEVISRMLDARVDKEVKNVETLAYMFVDIMHRPAINDAYNEVLKAEGIEKLAAADRLKERVIEAMKEQVAELERTVVDKEEAVVKEARRAKKAEGKARYLKSELTKAKLANRKKKRF